MYEPVRSPLIRTLISVAVCAGTFCGTLGYAYATQPGPSAPHVSAMVCEKHGVQVDCYGPYSN